MKLKYARQLSSNKRVEILRAVEVIGDRYLGGDTYTAVNMPPRYGKSAVIRLTALEMHELTKLPIVMVAPWADNVDQIKEKDKIVQTFKDYGIIKPPPFKCHRIEALSNNEWWKQSTGVPVFQTCTMGLINNKSNQQQFIDGLSDLHQRTGYRPIVLIDECHLIRELKPWADFVSRMVSDADAFVVLLTGTAVPGIPGFEYGYGEWKEFVRKIPRRKIKEDGTIEWIKEIHEGNERDISKIKAHVEVTWKRAWDIGALAHVNAAWVNTEVIDHATNESLGKLSDLEKEALAGRIKEIMESPEMIGGLVKAGINRLLLKRKHAPYAQAIVFTGADEFDPGQQFDDRTVDKHAKEFKRLLEQEAAERKISLRIEIATGNVDDASGLIKQFRAGKIDVLIVKMMGAVGLDVQACKVLIWGSRMRSGPLAIQALSRVLTSWSDEHADMILPGDCRMEELYKNVVSDHGGDFHESKSHLVGEEEYKPAERPEWRFGDARVDSYSDERGTFLNGEFEDILHLIKQKYQTQGMSDIQIIENFHRGGFPIPEEEEKDYRQEKEEWADIVDLDEELIDVKGKFGERANEISNRFVDYKRSPDLWLKKNRELKAVAKEMCGVANYIEVSKIDDAALLKKLKGALDVAAKRVFAGHA